MRKSLISMIKTASKKEDERDIAEVFKNDWVYCNENSEKSHPASKTLSPSSMQCQRMMSCKLLSVPKSEVKSNFSLNMICEIGSCIHAYTQKHCLDLKKFTYVNVADYVRENNLPLEIGKESDFEHGEYETHLYALDENGNRIISFLCDGILKDNISGKYIILELKSCGSSGFFKMDNVLPKHYNQAIAYSILLDIPSVLFVYINRDIPVLKPFIFTATKEQKQELKDKWDLVISKAKENIILPKEPNVSKNTCSYCDWRKFCNKIGDGEYSVGEECNAKSWKDV